ncbi:MAG TPA: 2-oxo-4-hydroxy-4-carboxy-5-ureidoimidazoline decarboxylase [Casimicrobiaceae bacterium]|jgi:2-oxo-4-hydroxy-4-carboxy-5-ureidoimidazoline decarboxylase|nr:2-oxo-4-hydroxy-4-carboxy-5-ureidoimidazoline decarboxylase [Casimicrobiaceae bacterium]
MTLSDLNALDRSAFVATLQAVFEHSPWIPAAVWLQRPFASVEALHAALVATMIDAPKEAQLALIRAHPELAGKAAVRGELTPASSSEQSSAGLTQCSAEEFAQLQALNRAYNDKFGFPFIIAVKGVERSALIARFSERLARDPDREFGEALRQIARIAYFRLETLLAECAGRPVPARRA